MNDHQNQYAKLDEKDLNFCIQNNKENMKENIKKIKRLENRVNHFFYPSYIKIIGKISIGELKENNKKLKKESDGFQTVLSGLSK